MATPVRTCRGFTLIELLVVISIVSLLISILLPALQGARRVAKDVSCANNQRQAYIAAATYATDWQDNLPYAPDDLNTNPGYMKIWTVNNSDKSQGHYANLGAVVPSYLAKSGAASVLYCPAQNGSDDTGSSARLNQLIQFAGHLAPSSANWRVKDARNTYAYRFSNPNHTYETLTQKPQNLLGQFPSDAGLVMCALNDKPANNWGNPHAYLHEFRGRNATFGDGSVEWFAWDLADPAWWNGSLLPSYGMGANIVLWLNEAQKKLR